MAVGVTFRGLIEQWKQYSVDQSGYISDESPESSKSILRDLIDLRADEVRAAMLTKTKLSDFMVQTLDCIVVRELDRAECPCAPASGCYWLKSEKPIPVYLIPSSVTGIVPVGKPGSEDSPRFTFIQWDKFQYIPYSRTPSIASGRFWTIRETGEGAYLYLYGDRFLENVAMAAIWENPIEAAAYPRCGQENKNAICNPLDVDCFTDPWIRKLIIAKSWQSLLGVKQVAKKDSTNDDTFGQNVSGVRS